MFTPIQIHRSTKGCCHLVHRNGRSRQINGNLHSRRARRDFAPTGDLWDSAAIHPDSKHGVQPAIFIPLNNGTPQMGVVNQSKQADLAFKINPSSLFADVDRPELSGPNTTNPAPAIGTDGLSNLQNGAISSWDVSRQIRIWIKSDIDKIEFDPRPSFYNTITVGPKKILIEYPADSALGNDDGGVNDEVLDPYVNKIQNRAGAITSSDAPSAPLIRRASGMVGDKVELMIQFREFARMNIGGVWIRISKYVTWRFDSKIKKGETGEWIDDGSITDNTNDGW